MSPKRSELPIRIQRWIDREHGGRVQLAAEALGITRQGLYNILNGRSRNLHAKTIRALRNEARIPWLVLVNRS